MSFLSRRRILTFISSLTILSIDNAFGATGPSIKCRVVGQTTIFQGKRYTCIRSGSGKKAVLIWNKGVKVPLPDTPSPVATPSSSASVTASPKPIQNYGPIDIELGNSSEVKTGDTVIFSGRDAYGKLKSYAITRTNLGLIALDTVCTHEGCSVEFVKKKLACPCHLAIFDPLSGAVESGPTNVPLKKYQVREVDGKIILTD